jgi:hypothetical protein
METHGRKKIHAQKVNSSCGTIPQPSKKYTSHKVGTHGDNKGFEAQKKAEQPSLNEMVTLLEWGFRCTRRPISQCSIQLLNL